MWNLLFVIAVTFVFSVPNMVYAGDVVMSEIVITSSKNDEDHSGHRVAEDAINKKRASTSDTASLLQWVPGVNVQSGGGVSGIPFINGMGEDRVKILVDGKTITAACPNKMNPALSYIDPSEVESIKVFTGVSPVSYGGDSIAGTISVDSFSPRFAEEGEVLFGGKASAFYRSNGNAIGGSLKLFTSTDKLNLTVFGSSVKSDNYKDGDGDDVLSTEYKSENRKISVSGKVGDGVIGFDIDHQKIPYEAFVNQYMDLTDNTSTSYNLRYKGSFGWGNLSAKAYRQNIRHSMDMLDDKSGTMPMETEASDTGYLVQGDISVSSGSVLKIGHEFHRYSLDDWWPPVSGSMMMGPDTFWNINDGKRQRIALFTEFDKDLSDTLSAQFGVRYERVTTDTGDVQGYSIMDMMGMTDVADSVAFNTLDRERNDDNIDFTVSLRFEPSENSTYDFGFAKKTRSPSLYERYAWSKGAMAGAMNNWFGDLNGYIGNVDLKPENAYTIRAAADWHDSSKTDWQFGAAVFFSYVDDYINVEQHPSSSNLEFVNHDADLYGADVTLYKLLGQYGGEWSTKAILGYVRGEDKDSDTGLYNVSPLNGKIAILHKLGGFSSQAEIQSFKGKDRVDKIRNEQKTSGYTIVNLQTSYTWKLVRFDLGVDNLFDKQYELPLGGLSVHTDQPVSGTGRSVYTSVTVTF